MDFNVSFQKSVQELTELLLRLNDLGAKLDSTENKASLTGSRLLDGFYKLAQQIQKVTDAYEKNASAEGNAESAAQQMGMVSQRAARVIETLAQAHTGAAVQAGALKQQLGGLREVMQETAVMQSYIRWEQKRAAAVEDTAGQERYLATQLGVVQSASGRHVASLAQQVKTVQQLSAAEAKLAGDLKLSDQAIKLATSAEGQALLINQERLRTINLMSTAQAKLAGDLQVTQQALTLASSAEGQALAVAKENLRFTRQQAAEDAKRANTLTELQSKLDYVQSAEGKREATLRLQLSEQKKANEEEAKAALGIDSHTQATTRLTSAMAQQIAKQRELEAATRAANEAMIKSSASSTPGGRPYTRSLQQTLDVASSDANNAELRAQLQRNATHGQASSSLSVNTVGQAKTAAAEQALANSVKIRNDYSSALAGTQHRLSEAEAATLAKTEKLTAATERNNKATLEAARYAEGLTGSKAKLQSTLEQEMSRLAQLRNEKAQLNTAEGQRLIKVRQQIAEEQKAIQSLGVLQSSHAKLRSEIDGSSQAGAAFRATLAGLRSSFGSFAGSTILVATGFFSLSSAVRSMVIEGSEYQRSLSRIQAQSTQLGDSQELVAARMTKVNIAVRAQAMDSIYNAQQTAEGFRYLVQSGQSAEDAIKGLPATLQLASISMLSMHEAADLATNIMSSFHIPVEGMAHTVDILAKTVTQSNTSIQEMGNALSYVGPVAKESGYSIEEMSAAIGVLADNGIKGSRAGTGLRGIITGLLEPSTKGKAQLLEMGIAVDDLDGKSRDLTDVFAQLSKALDGKSETERLKTVTEIFGRYAQPAAMVMLSQTSRIDTFKQKLLEVDGVAKNMSDTIRNNLAGAWENMTSAKSDVFLQAFNNVEPVLKTAVMSVQELFTSITDSDVDGVMARIGNTALGVADALGKVASVLPMLKWPAMALGASMAFKSIWSLSTQAANGLTTFGTGVLAVGERFTRLRTTAVAGLTELTVAGKNTNSALTNNFLGTAEAIKRTSASVGVLKTALAGVQTVMGWMGAVIALGTTLYSAYHMFYTDSTTETANYKDALNEAIKKQTEFNGLLQREQIIKKQDTLKGAIDDAQAKLKTQTEQLESLKAHRGELAGPQMDNAIQQTENNIETLKSVIADMRKELIGVGAEMDNIVVKSGSLGEALRTVDVAKAEKDELTNKYMQSSGPVADSLVMLIQKADEKLQGALTNARQLSGAKEQTIKDGSNLRKVYVVTNPSEEPAGKGEAAPAPKMKSVAEINQQNAADMARIKANAEAQAKRSEDHAGKIRDIDEEIGKITKAYGSSGAVGASLQKESEEKLQKLYADRASEEKALRSEQHQLAQSRLTASKGSLSLADLKSMLSQATADRDLSRKNGDVTQEIQDNQTITSLKSQISSLEKAGSSHLKKENKEMKEAQDVFTKLVESLDDGSLKAVRLLQERMGAIDKLFPKGSVGHTAAQYQAQAAYQRDLAKTDQYYKDPKSLINSYAGGKSDRTQADYDSKELQSRYDAIKNLDFSKDSGKDADRQLLKIALEKAKNSRSTTLLDGLEPTYATADLGGFQDAYTGVANHLQLQNKFDKRGTDLDQEKLERLSQSSRTEEQSIDSSTMSEEEVLAKHKEFEQQREEISREYLERHKELELARTEATRNSSLQMAAAISGSASTTLSTMSSMAKQGSSIQKAMSVASKAFHYAQMAFAVESAATQIEVQGMLAAAVSGGSTGGAPNMTLPPLYSTLATMTRVMGYANLALTAISDNVSTGDSDSSSSSSSSTETKKNVTFSGFKDKGGFVGDNEWAIVGEYGPEIVQGPANVVSRQETAAAARSAMSGGNSPVQITVAPTIHVTAGDGSKSSAETQGKAIAEVVDSMITERLQRETEHGGLLSRG